MLLVLKRTRSELLYRKNLIVFNLKFLDVCSAMKYHLKYWQHYLLSHSRHGTHSPFVYKLVDEVIYQDEPPEAYLQLPAGVKCWRKVERKKYLLISRLLKAFAYDQFALMVDEDAVDYRDLFERQCGNYSFRNISYIDQDNPVTDFVAAARDRDMLIVNEPHLNTARELYWNKLKVDDRVVVTVDLYHLGLVFFRAGQRKENFFIRF